ncbi:hypothetical protein GCM10027091_20690 [Streptomyces daliensis]
MYPSTGCNPRGATPAAAGERLAKRLAPMLPGAVEVRVRLQGPRTLWPHLRLTAVDEQGRVVPVARAKALTIARWIIRSFPHAGWADTCHVFDLRTATLHGLEAR